MKDYLSVHPWKIIEEGFHAEMNKVTESIFSLGNGRLGQRANFEEYFSGESLQGNYIGGVYYPDKTRVGWWKNGYPEYYAKVLNAANWNILDIHVNGERLDLAQCKVLDFRRELDMQEGVLRRFSKVEMSDGVQVEINSQRINSFENKELGLISYQIKLIKGSAKITCAAKIDFDVRNEDSNYEENFWHQYRAICNEDQCTISAETKKTAFQVTTAQTISVTVNEKAVSTKPLPPAETEVGSIFEVKCSEGDTLQLYKYVILASSLNHEKGALEDHAIQSVQAALANGYDFYLTKQKEIWANKWKDIDITIEGDDQAQQGIRFNIFQLHQTYTGDDYRLNIGPKGFTGERYGGSTYWDTEAYCLPFYMSTAEESVGEALLIYRYKHLQKAIENAEKLGFTNGAALYPMVTMNGEECHNEWEITFEEIHRNGAIAYAIYDYINYTGKQSYMAEYGLEVLIAISRFWAQRIHFSEKRQQYVMLGITGPNEYENNVNNNWYTNYLACWTLRYTIQSIIDLKEDHPEHYERITQKTQFKEGIETGSWLDIIDKMYYPYDEEYGIYLQQDNYLDKEQILVKDLPEGNLPLNQNWSWDRILRSCFIKQADVLQGFFFFQDEFDIDTLRKNFLFYEPRTVHESSLSPCIHAILASKLDMPEKAYEMYNRTARLDLNDYNNDTEDGLHITSMAGTWMSIVKGFGGMQVINGIVHFEPKIPKSWKGLSFRLKFRGTVLDIVITSESSKIIRLSGPKVVVAINGNEAALSAENTEFVLPNA
ncbi:family 65 glycosyl hydrolase domain-containing protein [Portibacter lacus]|uniref:Maltose phosphorylase n=1 Tax=Portibacter lacus TaxID=1099794 RepID=A0AA37SL72_9BACT|nr:family 65 glycosyl hydrolase domain-containing protein [Portibacter lacus]GLR15664.1 maltose phosphorylase [Portibacter lacus]